MCKAPILHPYSFELQNSPKGQGEKNLKEAHCRTKVRRTAQQIPDIENCPEVP